MKDTTEVTCPTCGSKIVIDPTRMLQGSSFSCAKKGCDTTIALEDPDKAIKNNAFEEFQKLQSLLDS